MGRRPRGTGRAETPRWLVGPRRESTAFCRSSPPSLAVAVDAEGLERLEPRVDRLVAVVVRAVRHPLAADRTETGAVGLAERRDRLRQLDRLAHGGLEVELVVAGQAEDVGVGPGVDRLPGDDVDRGKCLFVDADLDRHLDRAEA